MQHQIDFSNPRPSQRTQSTVFEDGTTKVVIRERLSTYRFYIFDTTDPAKDKPLYYPTRQPNHATLDDCIEAAKLKLSAL